MQIRLEIDQRPLEQFAFAIPQHAFCGMVGVAHMTVPIDPENAHGALVDGELAQTQRFFPRLAFMQVIPGRQQAALQLPLLATLPDQRGDGAQQQHAEQQRQILPEACAVTQARILRLQPALVQLLQLFGWHGL